ncbi:MAG: hypothetical protein AB8G77_23810 [Rhodothermales bacterium]
MVFEDIIEGQNQSVVEVVNYLRQLITSLDPEIEEGIYGGKVVKMASYSIGRADNVIAVVGPASNHTKLFLHHTDNIDAKGLKLEGKGKHAKHIKIQQLQVIDQSDRDVLLQVVAIVKTKV